MKLTVQTVNEVIARLRVSIHCEKKGFCHFCGNKSNNLLMARMGIPYEDPMLGALTNHLTISVCMKCLARVLFGGTRTVKTPSEEIVKGNAMMRRQIRATQKAVARFHAKQPKVKLYKEEP